MNRADDSNQSLVKQIVQKTLKELERAPEFDSETVERVKHVIANRGFKKVSELSDAIKPVEGVNP